MWISELYICTQGEGPLVGTPSVLVRTSGCNLRCGWKSPDGKTSLCDTWWTSWKTESDKNRVELKTQQVYDAVIELATKDGDRPRKPLLTHVIISGGEPMLAGTELRDLCAALMRTGFHITIETNGTKYVEIPFNQNNLLLSISPKLKSSTPVGTEHEKSHSKERINAVVLEALLRKYPSYLKFVVSNESDIKEIQQIQKKIKLPHHRVVLMPEGTTREQILKSGPKVHALCMKYAYRYSPREHIILFDNQRQV